MVAAADRPTSRLSHRSGERSEPLQWMCLNQGRNTSSVSISKIGRVAKIRKHFEAANLPATVVDLLSNSVKTSTTEAWTSHGTNGVAGVRNEKVIPYSVQSQSFIFLAEQFRNGKQYRINNVLRLAISSANAQVDDKPIGQHPLVRLMKGVSISRPQQPRYQFTWNVRKVINYLASLGENSSLSEKQLAQKLCMLMSLTCPGGVH